MPLFSTIESEVSAFFVSQGAIFDTILKTLLERLAQIENRVETNVENVHTILQQFNSIPAVAPAGVEDDAGDPSRSQNEGSDLEQIVLALSRQLHAVLVLLFEPLAADALQAIHARQQQLPTVSHFLRENESILSTVSNTKLKPVPNIEQLQTAPQGSLADDNSAAPVLRRKETELIVNVDAAAERPRVRIDERVQSQQETGRHRKESTFSAVQSLQLVEERRREHDEEMLARMQRMINEAQTQNASEMAAWRSKQEQVVRDIEGYHEKLKSDWEYQQQQQLPMDFIRAQQELQQKEMDKQFLSFTNSILVSQTTQEKQIAKLLDMMQGLDDRYISKADVDALASTLLQDARDSCVFGVTDSTLQTLQQDLIELHKQLRGESPSPVLTKLLDEVEKILNMLDQLLALIKKDEEALHGFQGGQIMQTLRLLVDQVEELAHQSIDGQSTSRESVAFLTDFTRQMELGTASILETIEAQQEKYQLALSQQHSEIEAIKQDLRIQQRELLTQQQVEQELREKLSFCPSQEDTLRIVSALKDQIQSSASDSTSKMLDTVEGLRASMSGLPTIDALNDLLHSKADRTEIDRLRLMLSVAANSSSGPSLAKSPTRCLSCDQTIPRSRPGSAYHAHTPLERPSTANGSRGTSQSSSPRHQPPNYHQHLGTLPSLPSLVFPDTSQIADAEKMAGGTVSPYAHAKWISQHETEMSTEEILRDLASAIEAAKRRKVRLQEHLEEHQERPEAPNAPAGAKRKTLTFVSAEDAKNRIPLRRPTLSDQVIYGPSIIATTLLTKKKNSSSPARPATRGSPASRREGSDSRPKTAIGPERRGGEVIMRAPTTTVVIRPFSEVTAKREDKRAT